MPVSPVPPATTDRPAGWFAHRPVAVKFGLLGLTVLLALGGVLVTVLVGD